MLQKSTVCQRIQLRWQLLCQFVILYKIFKTSNAMHFMFKYFTIAEANKALPEVAAKFNETNRILNNVKKIEKRLQMTVSDTNSNGNNSQHDRNNTDSGKYSNPLKTYMELKQELNSTVTKLYQSIETLESIGVSLKGLEDGLVDFPSKRFGQDVWLCWKFGETEIKFWHDMENGFMGRKPIEVSVDSLV